MHRFAFFLLLLAPVVCHAQEFELFIHDAATAAKVWKAQDVLSEKPGPGHKTKIAWCNGGRFKPCVCPNTAPDLIKYRPAVSECGGRAAIFLLGKWKNAYSVVLRDSENRDRWPLSGINGCSAYETRVLGLNKCSAFKTQKKFYISNGKKEASVHCMGGSGYGDLLAGVVRATVKLIDVPGSTSDPLMRFCIKSPRAVLN